MAIIRKFPGKKEEKQDNMNFSQKLYLHKLKGFVTVFVCVALILIAAIIMTVSYKNQLYTTITTVHSIERKSIETNSYVNNDGSLIIYSKDGVSCIDPKGNSLWNMTYEMQNPIVRRSAVYVAVADYDGHVVHVVDNSGKVTEIDTKVPIRDFSISKEGLLAVILEDTGNSWVNLYNVNGSKIVEVKATMSKTGYPLSVALSGEVMAVTYLYVDSNTMKSSVTFYNFGGIGENVRDRIVSSYEYVDSVVPYIDFMDSENIMAVADNRLMFYEGAKKPVSTADVILNDNVIGVYKGKNQVGLVFYDTSGEYKYNLCIYDQKGKMIGNYKFSMDFKDIVMGNNQALIYNEGQCIVITSDGTEKYNDFFEEPVKFIANTDSARKYLFVKEESLETVKFE